MHSKNNNFNHSGKIPGGLQQIQITITLIPRRVAVESFVPENICYKNKCQPSFDLIGKNDLVNILSISIVIYENNDEILNTLV